MEMKKYKLGEIAKICNGSTPSTKEADNYDGDIIWVTPKDLSDQKTKYFYQGERNITKKGFDSCSTQMIPANNILMSSRAPIGLFAINKVDCCTNQGFKNIIINKSISDVDFLYYYLKYHVNEIETLGTGTTFKEVSKSSFEKYEIEIPDLPTQQKIAEILSSLDDKIALNKKINAKLEAMAKRLYDYWFVQFDYPDKNGKPYKTSGGKMVWNEVLKREIPEGWEVKSINEVCDVIDCLHSKKPDFCYEDEESYLLSLENITKEGYIDISEKYYISKKDFSEWTSRICVKENDFLFTNAGRAGDMGMIPNGIKCAIGRNITAVRSKKINPYYLRCFFKSLYMKEQILNNLDKGCFFMSFNVRSIKQLSILISKEENFHKFISFCEPIIKQLNKNNSEIQKLTNLRDRLLPLLMNGQVEVEG